VTQVQVLPALRPPHLFLTTASALHAISLQFIDQHHAAPSLTPNSYNSLYVPITWLQKSLTEERDLKITSLMAMTAESAWKESVKASGV